MTKKEFDAAVTIAKDGPSLAHELDNMDTLFDGFALASFEAVTCTLDQVAMLIRWQCHQLNGQWDMEAMNEIRTHGRKRFMVTA